MGLVNCIKREYEAQKDYFIEEFAEKARSAKEIVVWGTGLAGKMINDAAVKMNIRIDFFADNNRDRKDFCDKRVLGIEDIDKDGLVIIAANVKYGIHLQLEKSGIRNYVYLDPVWLYFYNPEKPEAVWEKIYANRNNIETVYELLEDEESRKVYHNVLLHRVIHDLKLVWDIYDEHQYFGNRIVKHIGGNIIDCGAFQGDTLEDFLKQIGEEAYNYYAFEAETENYCVLKNLCIERKLTNVKPIHMGVWDKKDVLYFESNSTTGEVSGKITDHQNSKEKVEVDSLDHVLSGEKIDFIKMDIEGAEIRALQGSQNIIQKYEPVLAISAYHELDHLWRIPLKIKELNRNYRIYFGHHMWNMADTVCYARIDK